MKHLTNTKGLDPKTSSCFNYKNGEVSELTEGEVCTYGGYESSELDRYSGGGWSAGQLDKVEKNMFILVDTGKEQCIKGGIVYTRDNKMIKIVLLVIIMLKNLRCI